MCVAIVGWICWRCYKESRRCVSDTLYTITTLMRKFLKLPRDRLTSTTIELNNDMLRPSTLFFIVISFRIAFTLNNFLFSPIGFLLIPLNKQTKNTILFTYLMYWIQQLYICLTHMSFLLLLSMTMLLQLVMLTQRNCKQQNQRRE